MTAALETARILMCGKKESPWNCDCSSCRLNRELLHPDLILAGHRYFDREIAASALPPGTEPKPASVYLFLRSIRKLTRRFDAVLREGESQNKSKTIRPLLNKIEESLSSFEVSWRSSPGSSPDPKNTETLSELCFRLSGEVSRNISVQSVRNIQKWLHLTPGIARAKTVILENVGSLQVQAANALLKTLEEPPENVYFILTNPDKDSLLPTIFSRVRPYRFFQRTPEKDQMILRRIFHEKEPREKTLEEFFRNKKTPEAESLSKKTGAFIVALETESEPFDETLFSFKNPGIQRDFLRELLIGTHEKGKEQSWPTAYRNLWQEELKQIRLKTEKYHLNFSLLLEDLFYRIREYRKFFLKRNP